MINAPLEHYVFLVNDEYVFVPYSETDVEGFIENEMAARIADDEEFRNYVNSLFADRVFKMNVENFFAGYPEYSQAYIEYVLICDEEDVPFDDGFYQFVAKRMIEDGEIKIEWEKVM